MAVQKFVGRAGAARELGLTPQRIWELSREGVLPIAATIDNGGRTERVFSVKDVEALRVKRAAARKVVAA